MVRACNLNWVPKQAKNMTTKKEEKVTRVTQVTLKTSTHVVDLIFGKM